MSNIQTKVLGNISSAKSSSSSTYTIPCYLEKASQVYCMLLDEKGQSVFEQKTNQPQGQSKISLKLSELKPGNYNCWIEIEGNMHLRPLHIVAKHKNESLFDKLKSTFM